MSFSFYTFLSAVVWSSVLIAALWLVIRNRKALLFLGVWPLLGVSLCFVCRSFLPVEWLTFTQVFQRRGTIVAADRFLRTPLPGLPVNLFQILLLAWGVGFLLFFGRFAFHYGRFRIRLFSFEPIGAEDEMPLYEITETLARQMGIKSFSLYMSSGVKTPLVTGFLRPIILFPLYPYSRQDYHNAMRHELTHWKNRDIWLLLLAELLRDVFWWNPLAYLLKSYLGQTLEIRCDLTLSAEMELEERFDYVETLKKTVRFAGDKSADTFPPFTIAELTSKEKNLLQRVDLLVDYERHPKRERRVKIITSILLTALMVFSYSFVVQPYYDPPREEIEEVIDGVQAIEITPENTYLIEHKDGTYTIVYNDGEIIDNDISRESFTLFREWGFDIRKEV